MQLRFLAATLCLTAIVIQPLPSQAQSGDDELARVHFQAGRSYYDRGEYERSIEEFLRAYELSRRPELFYNLSLSYQQVGDLDNAIRYLERYLVEVPEVPDRANKEVRLANLRERRAAQREGRETETPITPATSGGSTGTGSTAAGTAAQVPEVEAPAQDSGGGIPIASIASFAVAGAGLVMMTTFGVLALGEQSDIEDGCGQTKSCSSDDVSAMDRLALLSDAGLLLAVIGSGVGIAMLFLNSGTTDSAELELTPWASNEGGGVLFGASL